MKLLIHRIKNILGVILAINAILSMGLLLLLLTFMGISLILGGGDSYISHSLPEFSVVKPLIGWGILMVVLLVVVAFLSIIEDE